MLNIAYNTARLTRVLEDYEEQQAYVQKRKAKNRGKSPTTSEIHEAITNYLQGETVAEIAKYLYSSPGFVKAIIDRSGVPHRPTSKEERRRASLLPEECISEEFEVGERVWSALHHAPAKVTKRLDDSYIEKYICPCYNIYVFEKISSSGTWFPGIETGGFFASSTAYDLGKLTHLKDLGIDLQRL